MLNARYKRFAKYNIYQIYPRSFYDSNNDGVGDLKGIILKLDYLKTLGINAIWMSPFFESPMIDNGYDISDYLKIDPVFGTMEDFDLLVKLSHEKNIKIIIDLVANHTSTKHYWFQEAIKSKDNPYHSYYYFFDKIPNDWKSCFYGSPYEYLSNLRQYYLHSFAKEQADLNWDNPQVREEIKKIVDFYINKGVDGFRCDVLDMISKDFDNSDGNHNGVFLHQYINEVFGRPHLKNIFTVGECWSTNLESLKLFVGQKRNELITAFQGETYFLGIRKDDKFIPDKFTFKDIAQSLHKWQVISQEQDFLYSLFLENHDTLRVLSKFHCNGASKYLLATLLATMVYALKGVTFIYQGQEIGTENPWYDSIDDFEDIETINYYNDHKDTCTHHELLKRINFHSRDNARRGMCWDDSQYGGFTQVKPWIKEHSNPQDANVKKDLSSEYSIYNYYSEILRLRNENEALTLGEYKCLRLDDCCYIYSRKYKTQEFIIINNFVNEIDLIGYKNCKMVLSNLKRSEIPEKIKPFESLIIKIIN